MMKIMLRDERVDVNQGDKNGRTTLWMSCEYGKMAAVEILFASGRRIDVTKKPIRGDGKWKNFTAAEVARKHNYHQIAELVDEYERNPKEVILRLRKELGNLI